MKINFRNQVSEEITDAGINLICDENMDMYISPSDYKRLEEEFPAAFEDSYVVEHDIEDIELDKHNNGGDYLSWKIDGTDQWCQGEFFVDKDSMLHHTAIAPNGDEVEITIKY